MLHGVGVRVPSAARKLEACSSYEEHAFLFLSFMGGKGNDCRLLPNLFPVPYGEYSNTSRKVLEYFLRRIAVLSEEYWKQVRCCLNLRPKKAGFGFMVAGRELAIGIDFFCQRYFIE